MTALKKLCLCMLAAVAVLGCAHDRTPAQTVADARIEYESLNYGRCQNLCDGLLADSAKFNELNVGQLCVLAELYTLLDSAANHSGRRERRERSPLSGTRAPARRRLGGRLHQPPPGRGSHPSGRTEPRQHIP